MAELVRASDRIGWTRQDWVADAERLLADVDGSILDLLNGHGVHMLAEIRELRAEVSRIRGFLAQACDEIDDRQHGPGSSAVAAELRRQAGK
jgi:hypothetical protein